MAAINHVVDLQSLQAALDQLHACNGTAEQCRAAEAALLHFQRSDAAWAVCVQLLSELPSTIGARHSQHLMLFAAQTLRGKLNEQGNRLDPGQHMQELCSILRAVVRTPQLPALLLRQLGLALTTLAALLPAPSSNWLQAWLQALPQAHAVQLLHNLAEEGASDWRHVSMPGLTSSEKLSWATSTRERFRACSTDALQHILAWLQQQHQNQQQQQQDTVRLLECLGAWVGLGALHHVSQHLAEQTASAGLLFLQSRDEQVLAAALALLHELPEFSTEQLLQALEPHMLAVAAAAAAAAAATPPDLLHASAWTSAFAAYAAALPSRLLGTAGDGDSDDDGAALRQALLQLSALPQLHTGQSLCLPALRVWAAVLGGDACTSGSPIQGGAGIGRSGAAAAAEAAGEDAEGGGCDVGADAADGRQAMQQLPAAVAGACRQLLLHTACHWLQWSSAAPGTPEAQDAAVVVNDVFAAVCVALGPRQYLDAAVHIWRLAPSSSSASSSAAAAAAGSSAAGTQQLLDALVPGSMQLPPVQQQLLQQALGLLAGAPQQLRLQVAVLMAAAPAEERGAAGSSVQEVSSSSSGGGGGAPPSSTAGSTGERSQATVASSIAELLSAAAAIIQQGTLPDQQQADLVLHFSRAVQAWAGYLVQHLVSSAAPAVSADSMCRLLHVLLVTAVIQQQQGEAQAEARLAGAAAVRGLVTAAHQQRWDQLHVVAPLMLQAIHVLPGRDVCEHDLLASLALCLVLAPEPQLSQLRSAVAQQLVQPAIDHVGGVLQQLRAGQAWAAVANPGDAQTCHHLVRVRAVLEASLQHQQHQQHQQHVLVHQQQQQHQGLGCCLEAASHEAMEDEIPVGDGGAAVVIGQLANCRLGSRSSSQQLGATAALTPDPALQLVLEQLWPQVCSLVLQHGGSGRFLQQLSSCSSKLLRMQPGLLPLHPHDQQQQRQQAQQQHRLQQLLDTAVAALPRPGGCSMAEPLTAVVELCCQQPGSALLLYAAPRIVQAFARLWALPEAAALQQPGAGDAQPDLVEALCKTTTAFMRHCSLLQPCSSHLATIIDAALAASAACGRCCHHKAGGAALTLLLGVLAAATRDGGPPQLAARVCERGPLAALGALGALLVPSPLPRLQKVAAILQELAVLASRATATQGHSDPMQQLAAEAAPAAAGGDRRQHVLLCGWLSSAAQGFVPQELSAADAAELTSAVAGLLAAAPSAQVSGGPTAAAFAGGMAAAPGQAAVSRRSYMVTRKLKRRLRDFAERHMRASGGGQLTSAASV